MFAPGYSAPPHAAPPGRTFDAAPPLPPPAGLAWDLLDAAGLLLVWIDARGGASRVNAAWRARVSATVPTGGHPARPLVAAATGAHRARLAAAYGAVAAPRAASPTSEPLALLLDGADGRPVPVRGRLSAWWAGDALAGVLAAFRPVAHATPASAAPAPSDPPSIAPSAGPAVTPTPVWFAADPVCRCVHDLLACGASTAPARIDPAALVRGVAAWARDDAARRSVDLVVPPVAPNASCETSCEAAGDALPVLAALLDAVGRAVGHSPAGGRVVARATVGAGCAVEFAVWGATWDDARHPRVPAVTRPSPGARFHCTLADPPLARCP